MPAHLAHQQQRCQQQPASHVHEQPHVPHAAHPAPKYHTSLAVTRTLHVCAPNRLGHSTLCKRPCCLHRLAGPMGVHCAQRAAAHAMCAHATGHLFSHISHSTMVCLLCACAHQRPETVQPTAIPVSRTLATATHCSAQHLQSPGLACSTVRVDSLHCRGWGRGGARSDPDGM